MAFEEFEDSSPESREMMEMEGAVAVKAIVLAV
jgi:hypothetical protein